MLLKFSASTEGPGISRKASRKRKWDFQFSGNSEPNWAKTPIFKPKTPMFKPPYLPQIGAYQQHSKTIFVRIPKLYNGQGSDRGSAHRKGVNSIPKVPNPQICDFSKFDRTFLETVNSDFVQIFSIGGEPGDLANGVNKSEIRLPLIEGRWASYENANVTPL